MMSQAELEGKGPIAAAAPLELDPAVPLPRAAVLAPPPSPLSAARCPFLYSKHGTMRLPLLRAPCGMASLSSEHGAVRLPLLRAQRDMASSPPSAVWHGSRCGSSYQLATGGEGGTDPVSSNGGGMDLAMT